MSALRQIASISLMHVQNTEVLSADLFGDQVVFGCCDLSGPADQWGVLVGELGSSSVGEFVPFPLSAISPGIDGYASTRALTGESLVVIAGEAPPYAPERGILGLCDRATKDWQFFRRDEACSPVIVGFARGASHVIHLNETSPNVELEIISLASPRTIRRIPTPRLPEAQCVALSPGLTHVAVAHDGAIACSRVDSDVECSWPNAERLIRLWFAEDDLAVVGASRDAIVLHQWKGQSEHFRVPSMRVSGFEPSTRMGFFSNQKTGEYVELDLSSGRARTSGTLPPQRFMDVDLRTRRIAAWAHDQRTLHVFQMP